METTEKVIKIKREVIIEREFTFRNFRLEKGDKVSYDTALSMGYCTVVRRGVAFKIDLDTFNLTFTQAVQRFTDLEFLNAGLEM